MPYKKFNEDSYIKDLESAPLHVSSIFEDVDDQMWFHNTMLAEIINEHAPMKKKKTTKEAITLYEW